MTATIPTPALDFVVFYVANLDTSFAFFKDKLGFAHQPEGDGPGFRQFSWGGPGLGFGLAQETANTPVAGTATLYLKTDDLMAQRERWLAQGVAASPIIQRPFGETFTVTTPDGLILTTMA